MEKYNSYEVLFIVDATLAEDAVKALVEKFTTLIAENSKSSEVNEWGKRRLAYPIDDKEDGYYVLVNFEADSKVPAELDRVFNITTGVLRSMIIKK